MAHAKRTQKRKARKGTREGTVLDGFLHHSICISFPVQSLKPCRMTPMLSCACA